MVLPWANTDMSDQAERVEELESKVERLEATIQGLTEELVEVHDRLETLEETDAAEQTTRTRTETEASEPQTTETEQNDEAKSQESHEEDETGDDSGLGDDIIVA